MENLALDPVANTNAIAFQLRAQTHQRRCDDKILFENGRGAFFLGQIQGGAPPGQGHFPRYVFGETQGFRGAVAYAKQGQRGTQTQIAHAMPALAGDFPALLFQGQAIDLDYVIEHAGENRDHVTIGVPIKTGILGKGIADELGQIDGAEQTGSVGGQHLLAAWIAGLHRFAEPVIVHFVDFVDQDESGFGVVISGRHDHVPQPFGANLPINAAGDLAFVIDDQALCSRPVTPQHQIGIL